jgi:hypothetical protein
VSVQLEQLAAALKVARANVRRCWRLVAAARAELARARHG